MLGVLSTTQCIHFITYDLDVIRIAILCKAAKTSECYIQFMKCLIVTC